MLPQNSDPAAKRDLEGARTRVRATCVVGVGLAAGGRNGTFGLASVAAVAGLFSRAAAQMF